MSPLVVPVFSLLGVGTTAEKTGEVPWCSEETDLILGTRELGLVKDTPGWTSSISSCAGAWTSPGSSGVRLKAGTMFDFF